MKMLIAAISTEYLKIRRSKIFLITLILAVFVPMVLGLMMFITKNPELAHKFGLLGAKATVINLKPDWPTYISLLTMAIVGLGLVLFGFIISWVFGREYSDHTAKDLLALPVSRSSIVSAKFIMTTAWCGLIATIILITGIIAGLTVQMPGLTSELLANGTFLFLEVSFLTLLLSTLVAFFAGLGRGYLAPVGFVLLALMVSQFVGALGFGPYFPWSIPMLLAEGASSGITIGFVSYLILFSVSIVGLILTYFWWLYADQQ